MLNLKYLTIALCILPLLVHAHPGRTDSSGGHTNRKTGEYHYHNSGSSSSSSSYSSGYSRQSTTTYTPPASSYKPPATTTHQATTPVVKNEAYYRDLIAKELGGQTEVKMDDGTYCDIVTDDMAIEVDWGNKWGEAIGQSLNYGFQSNKTPAIYLILKSESDLKYFIRVNSIIKNYDLPIKVFAYQAY
ncbi:YHYH domain-containing protein [Rubellicoccus peritrichatus]|uniref:YHYH domain-containing protein n=1 Tax=Rubellicoccus peritrichatus TaxID=3080537 RepID=A0AAQ3QV65_9BACT|nr:YHYH domain-containing protein [Puniceicoccus sp. CR14]WOO43126.1 YHYH domain-containing protein [Puniceicoccus sp. CR14]